MEGLAPLGLEEGPDGLDRIQFRGIGGQEVDDVALFLEPGGDNVAMVGPMIVHHKDGGPRVLDEGVDFVLEEVEEVHLVGALGKRPVEIAAIRSKSSHNGH